VSVAADVAARVTDVRERIASAARRSGRDAHDVTLVAVTKSHPIAAAAAVLDAGVVDLGENRAQELVAKAVALAGATPAPRWHMVGRLQRNKVRALAPHVVLWHSVDRAELGPEIARHAPGARVLVEVGVAGEPQKGGCAPGDAGGLVDGLRGLGLDVAGLMTVPPLAGDPRPVFEALRSLAERLGLGTLSMGMTHDFEVAIEEGATLVRIGTALLGERPNAPTPG
jgi:pyridoxal phosphate enzyme (YggS family)